MVLFFTLVSKCFTSCFLVEGKRNLCDGDLIPYLAWIHLSEYKNPIDSCVGQRSFELKGGKSLKCCEFNNFKGNLR